MKKREMSCEQALNMLGPRKSGYNPREALKWFPTKTASKADVPGYYCLGFNEHWSDPRVRVGCFDFMDTIDGGNRFKLIGGPHMELGPSHIARLPSGPLPTGNGGNHGN